MANTCAHKVGYQRLGKIRRILGLTVNVMHINHYALRFHVVKSVLSAGKNEIEAHAIVKHHTLATITNGDHCLNTSLAIDHLGFRKHGCHSAFAYYHFPLHYNEL